MPGPPWKARRRGWVLTSSCRWRCLAPAYGLHAGAAPRSAGPSCCGRGASCRLFAGIGDDRAKPRAFRRCARAGAAYSATTGSAATARAVTRSNDSRASAKFLGPDRGHSNVLHAARGCGTSNELGLAAVALECGHLGAGQRDRQRKGGEPGSRAEISDCAGPANPVDLEGDQGIGEMVLQNPARVGDRRRGQRVVQSSAASSSSCQAIPALMA